MTRAFNLAMTEAEVVQHCRDKSIAISAIEALPDGGVRLVCMPRVTADQRVITAQGTDIAGNSLPRQRPLPPKADIHRSGRRVLAVALHLTKRWARNIAAADSPNNIFETKVTP